MKKIKNFIGDVRKELRKVIWPNGKSMLKYSVAVFTVIIFLSIFFLLVNVIWAQLMKWIIG